MGKISKIFVVLLVGFFLTVKSQENAANLLSLPDPIELNETEFYLAWSKQNSKTLAMQQYLPKDETIEMFSQLLNFSYFNKDIELELAVRQKVDGFQTKLDNDKYAEINVTEGPDGKEFIVDFTLSESDGKKEPYLEYNIYRFKKYDALPQKPLLILNYAKRIYGTDFKQAKKAIMKERDVLMTNIIQYKIPDIVMKP